MSRNPDITGQKFNKLTAIKVIEKSTWLFQCDCGNFIERKSIVVRNGNTKSCGCIKKENLVERNTTHGLSKNSAYENWKDMFKRCKPGYKRHSSYYDRGITVDPIFKSFKAFLECIGEKPIDGQRWTVGRINNDKGYTPSNIRWETLEQQNRNHTLQDNNTSGVVGIRIKTTIISGKKYPSWCGVYNGLDGKRIQKEFSINKFGYEEAKKLATEFRENGIRELNEQGADYGESHGNLK